jgi:hypothetical protein
MLVVPLVDDLTVGERLARLSRSAGDDPPLPLADRLLRLAADTSLSQWTRHLARCAHPGSTEGTIVSSSPPVDVETVILLKTVDIFARVPYAVLSEVATRLRRLSVPAGTRILDRGEVGDELYIVTAGEVEVGDAARVLARIGQGSIFGEMAVLDPGPRSAAVTAVVATELLVLDRRTLLDLMGRRPEIADDVITVLVRRLRAMSSSDAPALAASG